VSTFVTSAVDPVNSVARETLDDDDETGIKQYSYSLS
jgi:hypothetical protein